MLPLLIHSTHLGLGVVVVMVPGNSQAGIEAINHIRCGKQGATLMIISSRVRSSCLYAATPHPVAGSGYSDCPPAHQLRIILRLTSTVLPFASKDADPSGDILKCTTAAEARKATGPNEKDRINHTGVYGSTLPLRIVYSKTCNLKQPRTVYERRG